jgi:hypothetical protein
VEAWSAVFAFRRIFAGIAGAFIAACSLVTDFDPSKIPPDATGGALSGSGGAGSGGLFGGGGLLGGAGAVISSGGISSGGDLNDSGGVGPVDASLGGAFNGGAGGVSSMGGQAGGGTGGVEPPPACDVKTNGGCAADELCCTVGQGVTCRKTSLKECAACNTPCAGGLAVACTARKCECAPGTGKACTGDATQKFCETGAPSACVACRDATDCAGRTDGKSRCVKGQCALCDPSQTSAGCTGKTPICDAATLTCKGCTVTPDNCAKPLVCTAGGACGSCATAADCATPTSPICDAASTLCRPCATNAECVAGPKLPFCVSQTCSSCNPATEEGCTDPTKPDCRGDVKGGYSCQPCNNGSCAGHPGTVCDAGSGRCVACVGDNDCSSAARTPFCANNQCVGCDTTTNIALVADLRCALKAGGQPACIRTGTQQGACGACDPGGSRGCSNNQLCCETAGVAACVGNTTAQCTACGAPACNPLISDNCSGRTCRCGSGAACSGTGAQRFCASATCSECRNDADCTSAGAPLCEGGLCVACNGAASAAGRCAAKAAGTVCATSGALSGRCTACDPATNAGCTATTALDQCDPATATCVDCVDTRGCAAPLDRCNAATHKCVDCDATGGCADVPGTPICGAGGTCRACASDAECAAPPNSGVPLCALSGACIPDAACAKSQDCNDGLHKVCVGLSADGGGVGHCRVCDPATAAGCAPMQTCSASFVCTG